MAKMFDISMSKNWPGGRRNATVIKNIGIDGSVSDWNHAVIPFKKPYKPEVNNEVSSGGMANPIDDHTRTDGPEANEDQC